MLWLCQENHWNPFSPRAEQRAPCCASQRKTSLATEIAQPMTQGQPKAALRLPKSWRVQFAACTSCCCGQGGPFTLLRHGHKPRADAGPVQHLCLQCRPHLRYVPQGAHILVCTHTCALCTANSCTLHRGLPWLCNTLNADLVHNYCLIMVWERENMCFLINWGDTTPVPS